MISSLACIKITLPAIRRNASPAAIGLKPGFLSNGIRRHARNAIQDDGRFSAVHISLITSAKVFQIELM